ncbi:MAG TPA: DUF488 domain-containing protein [bacterium]|nr:DUF488 domain-containing protein [bacterium]
MIRLKRVYLPAKKEDGQRFLVDRLWPRGVKKEKAKLTGWIREIAPSDALRKWFGHDPARWPEFQKRYRKELSAQAVFLKPLLEAARKGKVTLLFAAKDEEHNNAVVLKSYLESELRKK